jgi:hypothetical protein
MNYHLLKQKIIQILRKIGIFELIRPFYKIAGDRRYLYYFTQGHIVRLDLREKIKIFEKILFGKKNNLNSHVDESLNQDLALLKDEGIVRNLKIFSENEIKKLTNFLFRHEVFDPLDPDAKTFSSLTPRIGTRIAYYDQTVIVKAPCVMEKANHPYLMELVGIYFGCNFCLDAINVWWSYPFGDTDGSLTNPQIFHRDLDALNFLKFFVYLTDVDEDSGPHVFVQKSHRVNKMICQNKFYSDYEIEQEFGGDILKITGQKGSSFLENTFAFHKGDTPKAIPRLLLQFIFSVKRTPFGPKNPFVDLDDFSNPQSYNIDRYRNKYFLKT